MKYGGGSGYALPTLTAGAHTPARLSNGRANQMECLSGGAPVRPYV